MSLPFNKRLSKKVEGYALFYTIVIALLMALITGFLLWTVANKGQLSSIQLVYQKKQWLLQDGMLYWQDASRHYPYNQSIEIDLYQTGKASLLLEKKKWGVFDIGIVSNIADEGQCLTALWGNSFHPSTCLYLTDTYKPIVIAGSTWLQGNVQIPRAGIQKGVVEGQLYHREKEVEGNISYSEKQLLLE